MQINPPFIPEQWSIPYASEQSYLEACMFQVPHEGSYPVSGHFCWHNGIHIQAPTNNNVPLPVRAIADGIVKFVQKPKAENATPTDPQNYNPAGTTPAWTDNGLVIIQHTLKLTNNSSTPFVFYSAYMHLSKLDKDLPQPGKRIWRKDLIGSAGKIYGSTTPQIHFEICCDNKSLINLIGRDPDKKIPNPPTSDGQTAWFIGKTLIYLPKGTPTMAQAPTTHVRASTATQPAPASSQPAPTAAHPAPTAGQPAPAHPAPATGQPAPATANSTSVIPLKNALWIEIAYEKGVATLTSYNASTMPATKLGGQAAPENAGENKLYEEAEKRHDSINAPAIKATSSVDGWYQLLRFGRVLGTAALPATAQHWRQVRTADSNNPVWVDLNAPGTHKFSEADFLEAFGWNFIKDDVAKNDQRCQSQKVKSIIFGAAPATTEAVERAKEQNKAKEKVDEDIVELLMNRVISNQGGTTDLLKRTICDFTTEWEQSTIQQRCAWIQQEPEMQENPDNWTKLLAHLNAVTCSALPDEYLKATWNWHPAEFIRLMRSFTVNKDILTLWDDACKHEILPDESKLLKLPTEKKVSNGCEYSDGEVGMYEYALRSSKAAVTDHEKRESYDALVALNAKNKNNNVAMLGMRIRLTNGDFTGNNGNGYWKDRIAVLARDESYAMIIKYKEMFTTQPTAHYQPRALGFAGFPHDDGKSVLNDHYKDIGRLVGDRTYEYSPGKSLSSAATNTKLGPYRFGGGQFNILKKTSPSIIERFVPNSLLKFPPEQLPLNSPIHMNLTTARFVLGTLDNGLVVNGVKIIDPGFNEGQTMHLHKGWNSMTGSAGCQTFHYSGPHDGPINEHNSDFDKMMVLLGPLDLKDKFQYALRKMYDKEVWEM